MYISVMYKFQSSTCKTVGEKLRTKLCPRTDGRADRRTDRRTDGRTAMAIPVYPLHFVVGGIISPDTINRSLHEAAS